MPSSLDERQQFLGVLDSVERVLVFIYRLLLAFVIAAVVAITGVVVVQKPFGAGNQGEWFYFGTAVLVVLGCAIGKFVALGRRHIGTQIPIHFQSSQQEGVHTWELRLGTQTGDLGESHSPIPGGSQFSFSRSFTIPVASLASEMLPDEATINCIAAEIARGITLEEACRLVQPRYDEWSGLQQRAYTLYVSRALEQRATEEGRA